MKKIFVSIAVLLAIVAAPAFAALDGTMSGIVKDSTGQPLPGVTVTVKSPVLLGVRTTYTREDGTYRLPNLAPGAGYAVTFDMAGFKSVTRSGLSVNVSQDTQVNPVLELASVQSEVVVTGEVPVVDVTQTNTAQNFTSEYLRKIPVGGRSRDYLQVVGQAAGAVGSGNSYVLGANAQENSFLIDGINTTDPVTHTFSFNLNFDAIQEMNFQTSGYAAEYGRATGGVVNVVTKSGGNDFSGSFDVRYTSYQLAEKGDHFDPDFTPFRTSPGAATLGGPVLRDRVWFFANAQHPSSYTTPATTNQTILAQVPNATPRGFEGWNWGMKLSFNATEKLNGFVNYTNAQARVPGATNSVAVRPEATSTQRQKSDIINLKLNSVFTDSWIGELQVGRASEYIGTGPTFTDIDVSRWTNRTQGSVAYDNYNNYQWSDRPRTQGGLNTTYFLTNLAGNHELKLGFDFDRTKFTGENFTTGTPSDPSFCSPVPGVRGAPVGATCGATFTFNGFDAQGNRVPYSQAIAERSPEITRRAASYAAYLQDQWRTVPRLTVNVGARWDRTQYFNNQDINVITFDKVQPRASVAYDIFGDGKTVARANYGLFYSDPGLTLIRTADTGITSPYSATYLWSASQKKWNLVANTERGGVQGGVLTGARIDEPLKPTYDEQINLAFERQLMKDFAFTATYFYRNTNNLFEDSCINMTECPDYWITNFPGRDVLSENPLKRTYFAYIFQLEYRLPGGRGLLNASYTFSKSRGSIDTSAGQYMGGDFDFYPYNFVNRYGYLSDDARNRFKVYGNYLIPFVETNLGFNYTYRSGTPYDVTKTAPDTSTEYVEPRGTSRIPVQHNLDLSLEKRIPLPMVSQNFSFSLTGAVYNVFNDETVTSVSGNSESSTFRQALTWARPRSYELGFRFEF